MTVELTGTVHLISDLQEISDKYSKKDLVVKIEENTPYPQEIVCQISGNKLDQLNGINHGMTIKVYCNLKGRGNNGKYFNNLDVWKIEKI